MIAAQSTLNLPDNQRIVITGIGLTAPNGNSLGEVRDALLNGRSGVSGYEIRYVGKTLAGVCDFDSRKYQARKDIRRGTRAGSVGVFSLRTGGPAGASVDFYFAGRPKIHRSREDFMRVK